MSEDSINSTEGYFTAERRSSCHNISVEFNNIVEENGVVTLTINDTSLWPYNTAVSVPGPVATVNIVNDDGELYLMFAIFILFYSLTSSNYKGAAARLFAVPKAAASI